ncbi:hypothetical protein ANCCAN_22919 [Ancylostoma caninum]|uniref:Uncharacterized protein n=1 Tax=Ancylostoma caninum TaxID=29170 RepID=A0A368FM96_ANCCA|nr:hypothetical protein ANCCAN_22919 [Ancylostoma caninum]
MGSPTLETMSPTNSLVRRVRKADAVGRLRARSDNYLWLFGQIHSKWSTFQRLLVIAHLFFLVACVWLMWEAGAAEFTGLPIPGLDGFSPLDLHPLPHSEHPREQEDSIYVSTTTEVPKPYLYISRNIASGLAYLYFFSDFTLPTPSRDLQLSLGGALFLWTIKSGRIQAYLIKHVSADGSLTLVIIDRPSLLHKSTEHCVKPSFLSRLSASNRSWRSYKSTDNPTLRGYVKKSDGESVPFLLYSRYVPSLKETVKNGLLLILFFSYSSQIPRLPLSCSDEGCPSLLSEEINLSFGSESGENNNLSRSFCAFNMSRRQLDTVHEEAESQESTLVSSAATDPSKIATRM